MAELIVKTPNGPVIALVDAEDLPSLAGWSWWADRRGYVVAKIMRQGVRKTVLLHRFLLGEDGPQIDHINGNPLDNQRANLRYATGSQNQINRRAVTGESRYKGVTRDKSVTSRPSWVGRIRLPDGRRQARSFPTEEEAAAWYRQMAREHYGEFAL